MADIVEQEGPPVTNRDWSQMVSLEEVLSPSRLEIADQLMKRPWFKRTHPDIRRQLLMLPEGGERGGLNFDGFLTDLANRPEVVADVEHVRLNALDGGGGYGVIPRFYVKHFRPDGSYFFHDYEYFSWFSGPKSGVKGIVFVRPAKHLDPTDLIVLRGERFATGQRDFDVTGGFGMEGVQSKVTAMVELRQELGVEDLQIDEKDVVMLGELAVDSGMTNNRPDLFAAFIDAEQRARIPKTPINPDFFELKSGAFIVPLHYLRTFIRENADAYFKAALLNAFAEGVIPVEWLSRPK